jgi:hypothetical protein
LHNEPDRLIVLPDTCRSHPAAAGRQRRSGWERP